MISSEKQKELLKIAIEAARAASKEILEVYRSDDFHVETKEDQSPLTLADMRSNQAIMNHLRSTGFPVLSEEGAQLDYQERSGWKSLWVVDPLDGTKEFIKRNGEFTVNIALVEDQVPVLGVVYVPVRNQVYFGASQLGAWACFESALLMEQWHGSWDEVADQLPRKEFMENRPFKVVASRSHRSEETDAFIEEMRKDHPDLELTSIGSSLKICLVAEGSADIYPRFAPTMEWDTASGHALLLAAGKELIDHTTGERMKYNRKELRNNWFVAK